jgi:hypothetical protein
MSVGKTAIYQRNERWRRKNGYHYEPGRGRSPLYLRWCIFKFIHEELGGPDGNIKSCLNPSVIVNYEAKLYMKKALIRKYYENRTNQTSYVQR